MGSACSTQPMPMLDLPVTPQSRDWGEGSSKTASPVTRAYNRINVAPVSFKSDSFRSTSDRSVFPVVNKTYNNSLSLKDGKSEIIEAVRQRNISEIMAILTERPNCIDERDKKGYTALLVASIYGREDIVRLLLDKGAKVDIQDSKGATALFMAAVFGHVDVVKVLLSEYASIGILTNYDASPLNAAENNNRQDVVKELVNFRASQYRSHLSGISLSSSEALQISVKSLKKWT